MILAQPGKREIREREADHQWLVYRFDPALETAMQWEIVRVFETREEARDFAFPHTVRRVAA